MNKSITSNKFATDTWKMVQMLIEEAVLAEREACALLCYEQRKNWDALACADAIRAGTRPRGQA